MKTPEEIKKGLKLCSHEGHGEEIICQHCPYDNNSCPVLICTSRLSEDALAYIQQLESRLAQAERERDAVVSDLEVADKLDCQFCVHNRPTHGCGYNCEKCEKKCTCNLCRNNDKYEWRGPCPENTPEPQKE